MKKLLPILLIVLMAGCTARTLDERELIEYIQDTDHGLRKEKQVNDLKMSVSYKPADLLVKQELSDVKEPHQGQVDSLRKKYEQYAYFTLSLSKADQDLLNALQTADFSSFSNTLQVISFRMGEYANLTTSRQDTIPVADASYTRLYGMGKSTDVLLVFNKEKMQQAEWVQFNLKDLGIGMGDHQFRFDTGDLNQVPRLKF